MIKINKLIFCLKINKNRNIIKCLIKYIKIVNFIMILLK